MPRYPVRPWWHPLYFMATNPHGYTISVIAGGLCLLYPWRHKLARYYERQRDSPAMAARQNAVRNYKHLEMMLKREILFKQPMVNEEQPYARIGQAVQQTSLMIGATDGELDYWNSHQRDMMRAAKLTSEIREIRRRQAAAAEGA